MGGRPEEKKGVGTSRPLSLPKKLFSSRLIPEHLTALALYHIARIPTLAYQYFVPPVYAQTAEQRHTKDTGNEDVGQKERSNYSSDHCQPLKHAGNSPSR
jgi:hypothetical protein